MTQTVTFAAGQSSATVNIPITSDTLYEGNEAFSFSLSSPSGVAIVLPSAQTITIVDDDLPAISFAASTSSVSEGAGSINVTVTLTTGIALPSAVSVNYASSNGTAYATQDYTGVSGTLTFSAGSTNGATRTINVPIIQDGKYVGSGWGNPPKG